MSLDAWEKTVIRRLETAGITSRKVVFASIPYGSADFDWVMPAEDPDRWLGDIGYTDLRGP